MGEKQTISLKAARKNGIISIKEVFFLVVK